MTVQIRHLRTAQPDFDAAFQRVLHWSAETDTAIEQRVADILADVRARGDAAVLEYTARFDRLHASGMDKLELGQAELKAAFDSLPAEQREALESAARRVRTSARMSATRCSMAVSVSADQCSTCWKAASKSGWRVSRWRI